MVDMDALTAALTSLNMAADLASRILKLKTSVDIQAKVIELNRTILTAQHEALQAQQTHMMLLTEIGELEAKIARSETWDAEKQRYELKALSSSTFAYMLKPPMRGTEPPHWVCPNCYENHKKSIFQMAGALRLARQIFRCSACNAEIVPGAEPRWLD